ncbi:hypothetical protein V6N13_095441 [Hibiscus sabdariffa]
MQVRRIEEIIEVEVGDEVFQVNIKEISFNDGTTYPLCNKWNTENGETKKKEELEIFNSNSEESDQVTMEDGQSCSGTEGEA